MSNFKGRFDFAELQKQLLSPRERVRRYFQKWVTKLNQGETSIKVAGIEVADLYSEFESRLRLLDEATLAEMIEDAHNL